ncbi:MAG: hypothetical protein ACI8RE_001172, partial [Ilumatobacter sp.]
AVTAALVAREHSTIDQHDVTAGASKSNRCGRSGGAAAHHQYVG